jgi:hypothetical protein
MRGEHTLVYSGTSHPAIRFRPVIAVTTLAEDGTVRLSPEGGTLRASWSNTHSITGLGTIDGTRGERARFIGFVFTSAGPAFVAREFNSVLMRVDLTGAHRHPVPDLAGRPLAVCWAGGLSRRLTAPASSPRARIQTGASDRRRKRIRPRVPARAVHRARGELARWKDDRRGDVFGKIAYSLADGTETRIPSLPIVGHPPMGAM